MNIAERTLQLKKDFDEVYAAGQSSMVDKSKIIEKTVSGEYISVDDVSEIPHEVKIKLTSGGKNLLKENNLTFTRLMTNVKVNLIAGKTYTFSALVTSTDTDSNVCLVYDATNDIFLGQINRDSRSSITFTPTKQVNEISLYASNSYANAEGDTATFKDIMIEEGDTATEYEPYKETLTEYSGVTVSVGTNESEITQTLTANADGTVEGVESTSPYMYMTTDNPNCTINAEYHKSYGMQTEYDRFWDVFQGNGNRTDYSSTFRGDYWKDEIFKPKYTLQPINAESMFIRTKITDIRMVDLTKATNVASLCNSSTDGIRYVGKIGNSSITTFGSAFGWCHKLISVEKMIVSEKAQFPTTFEACYDLESITFEGTIAYNISFASSSKLNKASILSVFNALSTTATGRTLTLSATAVTKAFGSTESTEWLNLVASKSNWSISLI